MFRTVAKLFLDDESGQDLAEYCLLTALLLLIGLSIFVYLSGGLQTIWANANSALSTGADASRTSHPGSH